MSKTRLVSSVITPEIEKWLEQESSVSCKTVSRFIKDILYEKMLKSKTHDGDSKRKVTKGVELKDVKNMF